jgi:hypothetical protein
MRFYSGSRAWLTLVAVVAVCAQAQAPRREALHAPTYYVVVEADRCERDTVNFSGASNLPPKALISMRISDFLGDFGWKDYSDDVYASVDAKGFFAGEIHPKKSLVFRRNLLLVAYFAPYRPTQPSEVLAVVGRHGERLGGQENPQLGQVSGPNYLLHTIARVPNCGENGK